MRSIVFQPFISPPKIRPVGDKELPQIYGTTSVAELCELAGLRMRVTGGISHHVVCCAGNEHFTVGTNYFVGVGSNWNRQRVQALRVLEVLAHGFHDYAARECVCGKGLFRAPKKPGRPLTGPRAKTASERMAIMRAKRRKVA